MTKKTLIRTAFLVLAVNVAAQSVVVRVAPEGKSIQVKWLHPELIVPGGFNVYRRTAGKPWIKLNDALVRCGVSAQHSPYLNGNNELKKLGRLAEGGKTLTGIPLMVCVLKSFEDIGFSRFLGILYDDLNVTSGVTYEYKITTLTNGNETALGQSTPIRFEEYRKTQPPSRITVSEKNGAVQISWDKETSRYFAVNIYRRHNDSSEFIKLNTAPLVASGDSSRSQFIDFLVAEKSTYVYYLGGLDFFGSQSKSSAKFTVTIPDKTAPLPVDSLRAKADGRKINLRWRSKNNADVTGFIICRTNRNDTDFKPLHRKPLPGHTVSYSDVVPRTGSFTYRILSIDGSGNQSHSLPVVTEAFDNVAPPKPSSLRINTDSGRIILQWKPSGASDVAGHHVYRGIAPAGPFIRLTSDPHQKDFFTDNIPPRTRSTFYYYITAIDSSLNHSVPSETVIARLPDREPPSPPFLQTAVTTETAVQIHWFPNPESDLKGYEVFRRETASSLPFEKISEKLIPPRLKLFIDRTAKPGEDYEYVVKAVDSTGLVSEASNVIITHKKRKREQPLVITLAVRFNEKRRHTEISWTADGATTAFVVYKSTGGPLLPITGFVTAKNFTDKQKNADAPVAYQVRAYSKSGAVSVSEIVQLHPQADYQP